MLVNINKIKCSITIMDNIEAIFECGVGFKIL